jgi:hypothetical protein
MASCKLAISRILFILFHMPLTAAQPLPLCDNASGNYTANNTYRANMQNLASSLPYLASTTPSLFAAGKSGTLPDAAIYAVALGRGDNNASSCAACVSSAIRLAQALCPLMKMVRMFDDPCIIRFSNQDFPHDPLNNRRGKLVSASGNKVSAAVAPNFTAAVGRLVNATFEYAAGDSIRRFGTGEVALDETKIYSLAQCTPDLTTQECQSCLSNIFGEFMPNYFFGQPGGRLGE